MIQSISGREYARQLIGERLVTSALATMSVQREPIDAAQRALMALAQDPDIIGTTDNCNEVLKRSLAIQRSIVNFGRLDADGFVKCSALPFEGPVSNTDQPWWFKGIADRRFTLSPPIDGKISKRRVIAAMLPIYDAEGRFAGATMAAIDASWIEGALQQRKLSPQAVVAVTDQNGRILIGDGRNESWAIDLKKSYGAVATLEAKDGSKWMYSSAPLHKDQLYVVYAEPQSQLLTASSEQLRINLLLPLLTVALTCLAVWWSMNRFVIRWLRSLSRLAGEFGRGNYESGISHFRTAPAEIATLGDDLHNMALSIEDRDSDLRAAAATTKAMAREVNHRVKNNLQMVMSLLGLHAARLSDPEAKRALDQTRLRMGAVSLIHRLLYELDESSERGEVDMDRLLRELCAQMRTSFSRESVALESRSSVGVIPVDEAIPLTLLIVEGITNSYRHAFPEGRRGAISISLENVGSERLLKLTDNGVGYASGDSIEAMGLELMQAFASQLGGTLETRNAPGEGVSIEARYRPLVPDRPGSSVSAS